MKVNLIHFNNFFHFIFPTFINLNKSIKDVWSGIKHMPDSDKLPTFTKFTFIFYFICFFKKKIN